jgi:KIF-binding protein
MEEESGISSVGKKVEEVSLGEEDEKVAPSISLQEEMEVEEIGAVGEVKEVVDEEKEIEEIEEIRGVKEVVAAEEEEIEEIGAVGEVKEVVDEEDEMEEIGEVEEVSLGEEDEKVAPSISSQEEMEEVGAVGEVEEVVAEEEEIEEIGAVGEVKEVVDEEDEDEEGKEKKLDVESLVEMFHLECTTSDEFKRLFEEHHALAVAENVKDSPKEIPFLQKYKARGHWLSLLECAGRMAEVDPSLVARLHYELGTNHLDSEENHRGEVHFGEAMKFYESQEAAGIANLEMICLLLDMYNYNGVLWSTRGELEESMKWLNRSESLFMKTSASVSEDKQGEEMKSLEEAYTMTVFYLAQVYASRQDRDLSAYYCHRTLVRQLQTGQAFNQGEWADNCVYLSGYYLSGKMFGEAEHCLLAADTMMPPDADDLSWANLHLAKGKYRLYYLKFWRDEKMEESGKDVPMMGENMRGLADRYAEDVCARLQDLGLNPSENGFDRFTDKIKPIRKHHEPITTFDEARKIFIEANREFQESLKYYVLDGFVTDHVSVLQDMSLLYKVLSFFEDDDERFIAMQKRRANILEDPMKQISHIHFPDLHKQLTFELGETYNEMVEVRLKKQVKVPKKINPLITKAVHYFDLFRGAYNDREGNPPKRYPTGDEHAIVVSRINVARLVTKFIGTQQETVDWLVQALHEYEWITEYGKKFEIQELERERLMAAEMAILLPRKISHLQNV